MSRSRVTFMFAAVLIAAWLDKPCYAAKLDFRFVTNISSAVVTLGDVCTSIPSGCPAGPIFDADVYQKCLDSLCGDCTLSAAFMAANIPITCDRSNATGQFAISFASPNTAIDDHFKLMELRVELIPWETTGTPVCNGASAVVGLSQETLDQLMCDHDPSMANTAAFVDARIFWGTNNTHFSVYDVRTVATGVKPPTTLVTAVDDPRLPASNQTMHEYALHITKPAFHMVHEEYLFQRANSQVASTRSSTGSTGMLPFISIESRKTRVNPSHLFVSIFSQTVTPTGQRKDEGRQPCPVKSVQVVGLADGRLDSSFSSSRPDMAASTMKIPMPIAAIIIAIAWFGGTN